MSGVSPPDTHRPFLHKLIAPFKKITAARKWGSGLMDIVKYRKQNVNQKNTRVGAPLAGAQIHCIHKQWATARVAPTRFVVYDSRSISSALFRVVSVILVPPMMRASSFFRPSMSRGVTVV